MNQHLRNSLFSALFTALIIGGSYVRIPLPAGVPITLQTLMIFLSALSIGYWSCVSIIVYLIIGIIGFPIFAGGGGLGVFLGPSGGFLVGFLVATFFIAFTRGVPTKILRNTVVLVGASLIIYFMGTGWYALLQRITLQQSIATLVPQFLVGDILKLIAAVLLYRTLDPVLSASR